MLFFRIFCALVSALGLHVSVVPPNPRLANAERRIESIFGLILGSESTPFICQLHMVAFWAAAFAEVATVLAQAYPSLLPIIWILRLGGGLPAPHLTPRMAIGTLLIASGTLLRWRCYRELGKHFTFEISIARDHKLITTGPYSYVRHPGYTGGVIVHLGTLCYYGAPGSWTMECLYSGSRLGMILWISYVGFMSLVTFGLLARIPEEEEALKSSFGDKWQAWAARVPHVLIPGLY